MRSIITIILLFFSLSVFSHTFYDAKTIKKEYGRISAYNANNILIYQVECDDATWLKFQDGSIKIWDDKKEFTIFSSKLTTPSWASVGDSLNKWMDECVAISGTPSNLDTSNYWILDSIYQEIKAVDTLCFTGEIAVKDSILRTTVVDCGGTNAIAVKLCEPLNVVTDTTINATIREMRDSIARQNIIFLNQSTLSIPETTPSYTSNRTLFTANTTPAAYSVGVPANTREITVQNITGADIQITTSQGTQILGTMNNITLSNPNNTTINHAVFTGNITISFFSSVLGDISGVAPRVIIDFKAY